MLKIQYPPFDPKIKKANGKEQIWDEVRKKWVSLMPEEWVRQNFLQYLVRTKKYPASLIAVEKEIWLNEVKKRCDIIIYKKDEPWMIIECKEMQVALSESVLQQIVQYNMALPVEYLVITNGDRSFAWHRANGQLIAINELPDHQEI